MVMQKDTVTHTNSYHKVLDDLKNIYALQNADLVQIYIRKQPFYKNWNDSPFKASLWNYFDTVINTSVFSFKWDYHVKFEQKLMILAL